MNEKATKTTKPTSAKTVGPFNTWSEFYPYYLSEHSNSICRRLHFVGTSLVISIFTYAMVTGTYKLLFAVAPAGYGFAWVGHFFFEKNKPATFKYPFYSLFSDFVMYKDMWLGRVSF